MACFLLVSQGFPDGLSRESYLQLAQTSSSIPGTKTSHTYATSLHLNVYQGPALFAALLVVLHVCILLHSASVHCRWHMLLIFSRTRRMLRNSGSAGTIFQMMSRAGDRCVCPWHAVKARLKRTYLPQLPPFIRLDVT